MAVFGARSSHQTPRRLFFVVQLLHEGQAAAAQAVLPVLGMSRSRHLTGVRWKIETVGIMGYNCWLVVSTPLKNMKVSWDDYSQYMEKKTVPNHQPGYIEWRYSMEISSMNGYML